MNPLNETIRHYEQQGALEEQIRRLLNAAYEEQPRAHSALCKRGKQNKVERGLPHAGLPLGYRFNRSQAPLSGRSIDNDTPIVIDEPAASFIQKAYELADKKGYSTRKIIAILTKTGLRSRHGKVLGPSSMWKVLTNPFYCGLIRFRGALHPGKHQPLVSKERFARVVGRHTS